MKDLEKLNFERDNGRQRFCVQLRASASTHLYKAKKLTESIAKRDMIFSAEQRCGTL